MSYPDTITISDHWDHWANRKYHEDFLELLRNPKATMYVQISEAVSSRKGSIGIAVPVGCDPNDRDNWVLPKRVDSYYGYRRKQFICDIYLGENKVLTGYNFNKRGLDWMPNYKGPATWVFTKKAAGEARKKHYDCLGDEIKLGDFGVYADTDGTIYFGSVTDISKAGAIYVTNITTPGKSKCEFRLRRGDQFQIMSKDIFSRLMVIKLADG